MGPTARPLGRPARDAAPIFLANRPSDVLTLAAGDQRPQVSTSLHPTPPSEARGPGPVAAAVTRGIDLRVSLIRGPARLPWRSDSAAADELPASDVLRAARAIGHRPGAFLVGGGDPLGRADLPTLLHDLAEVRSDNLGLTTAGARMTTAVVHRLRDAGVQRINVPFHCARRDAHDWLVGQPGSLKAALRAIRTCVDSGMVVTAEVAVTRPTMPHLAETVDVLTRVGVRTISLRRLTAVDVGASEFAQLSPRLSLLADDLERAATTALQRRARLVIRDFPVCVAPRLRRLFAGTGREAWLTADGVVDTRVPNGPGCPDCPGTPTCAGAPADYVSRFGWEELADSQVIALRVDESVTDQQRVQPSGTMVFSWRGPRRVSCQDCTDAHPTRSLESTRVVRARLVEAARYRPAVLRLVGAELLSHPAAAALLYDAVRLFPRVECAGEASAVVGWTDVDLRRLKELHRFDVAFYGPDAPSHDGHCGIPGSFAATLRAVDRLREHGIAVGAYAIVHDGSSARRFADAWTRRELPGSPRFRLAGRGSSLDELVECARDLSPGAARSALLGVLPRCLCEELGVQVGDAASVAPAEPVESFGVAFGRRIEIIPCGSDSVGAFASCRDGKPCAVVGCPGTAVGWQRGTRSERWMLNS
jgi:MoaA/NifB/PqqE/SkfB family radical SAM enzyme